LEFMVSRLGVVRDRSPDVGKEFTAKRGARCCAPLVTAAVLPVRHHLLVASSDRAVVRVLLVRSYSCSAAISIWYCWY